MHHVLLGPRDKWAALGCLTLSLVAAAAIGFVESVVIVMGIIEGGYRSVPVAEWWLLREQIVAAWLVPVAIAVAVTTVLAHRDVRWLVLKVGLAVWGAAAVIAALYVMGVL